MLYVIGDIHGCYDPLRIATDYIYSRKLAGEQVSGIVFLGDYIDCGPNSKAVIDHILSLRQDFDVITLLGNHEDMLLGYYERGAGYKRIGTNWLLNNGGVETVHSLFPQSVLFREQRYPDASIVNRLIDAEQVLHLEESYLSFFLSLLPVCSKYVNYKGEALQLLFCHAIPSPDADMERQLRLPDRKALNNFMQETGQHIDESLIWNRRLLQAQLMENTILIHGHTPTRYYKQLTKLLKFWEEDENAPFVMRDKKTRKPCQIDIDTGLIYGGALTILAIDDSADATNLFPHYISILPGRGYRHKLYDIKLLDLLS